MLAGISILARGLGTHRFRPVPDSPPSSAVRHSVRVTIIIALQIDSSTICGCPLFGAHPARAWSFIPSPFLIRPWIDDRDASGLEISGIAGHEVQAVSPRGGGDQTVGRRYDPVGLLGRRGQLAPQAAGFEVDGEEPVGVVAFESLQPAGPGAFFPGFLSGVRCLLRSRRSR